ncbi:MerR family transcriptional regulator [Aridibaculum aurantiacum]|uniref:MerR family transcriptional regulator n=1 Tax=Aridibaculum aurantiacum TaxID=2810307 RepID=UPI001A958D35|nr:MerR family transcriptional regulator [Aridibaculum aurantiacum]
MRQLDLFADVFSPEPKADALPSEEARSTPAHKQPPVDENILAVDDITAPHPAEADELEEDTIPVDEPGFADDEVFSEEELEDNSAVEATAKSITAEITGVEEPIEVEAVSSIVYSDGKIAVKIKAKTPVNPAPAPEPDKAVKLLQKRGRKSFKEITADADLIEVPDDEELFQKQYYTISEVARWFKVNVSLLRFWCNEFDVLKPRKNRKGDRLFRPEDVKNLQLIYQLLRVRKFSMEGAKDFIKANKSKADTQLQLTQTLLKFRSFLLEIKANL